MLRSAAFVAPPPPLTKCTFEIIYLCCFHILRAQILTYCIPVSVPISHLYPLLQYCQYIALLETSYRKEAQLILNSAQLFLWTTFFDCPPVRHLKGTVLLKLQYGQYVALLETSYRKEAQLISNRAQLFLWTTLSDCPFVRHFKGTVFLNYNMVN